MRVAVIAFAAFAAACASRAPRRATCGSDWRDLSHAKIPAEPAPVDVAARDHTTIEHVDVRGVERELVAAIRNILETRVGTTVADAPLARDLKRVWALGVISDARVEVAGGDITFVVVPRATIRRVVGKGGDREAQRRFRALAGAPYEPERIARIAAALEASYVRDGRLDAKVEARSASGPRGVDLCVATNPGPRVTIGRVEFPGRTALPADKLLAALPGADAKVNRVGGTYDGDALESDKWYLLAEYWELGYAEAQMSKPSVRRHGNRLVLSIPIEEGAVYRLGRITTPVPIAAPLGIAPGDVFSRTKIEVAREKLAELVGGSTNVLPVPRYDSERRLVSLHFDIAWRWPWDALRFWLWQSR